MSNRFLAGVLALLVVGLIWYANGLPGLGPKTDQSTPQQTDAKKDEPKPAAEPVQQAPATESPKVAEAAPEAPKAVETPAPAEKTITPPSFDTVRVEPTGEVVVAGRGEPDSTVTLMINGKSSETAELKETGQFVVIPPPLKPGAHSLALSMKLADGKIVSSVQDVTVDVPDNSKGNVVVALSEPGKATEILVPIPPDLTAAGDLAVNKLPAAGATVQVQVQAQAETGARAGVAIIVVEAEDTGTLYASGTAAKDASVRLYLNETYLDTAQVGTEGKWSLKVAKGITPGTYNVRVDDVEAATGKVLSRAEVKFDFAPKVAEAPAATETPSASTPEPAATTVKDASAVVVDAIETATVVRGDSLWRISKKTYGSGFRYLVIHQANKEQIRNPDLIYPGQVFVLPKSQ
jgi:LysM repeat protein